MPRESQKQRSEALRQKILDTALQIGLEEGFEALSVRKIINRLNYSTSIIYHHFKNKQEIIDMLVQSLSQQLAEEISSVINEDNPLIDNLKTAFHLVTMLAVKEPEKYNLIVLRKYSSKGAASPQWVNHICKNMETAIAQGQMRKIDAYSAAYSVWSSFLGFHIMLSLQEGLTEQKTEELFCVQMDILLNGILK